MFAAKKSAQFSTPGYDEPRAFAAVSVSGGRWGTGDKGVVGMVEVGWGVGRGGHFQHFQYFRCFKIESSCFLNNKRKYIIFPLFYENAINNYNLVRGTRVVLQQVVCQVLDRIWWSFFD